MARAMRAVDLNVWREDSVLRTVLSQDGADKLAKAALRALLDHPLPEEVIDAGRGDFDWGPSRDDEPTPHLVFTAMIRKMLETA
jgi:hypothetical protein